MEVVGVNGVKEVEGILVPGGVSASEEKVVR